jgi:hypothetical protein
MAIVASVVNRRYGQAGLRTAIGQPHRELMKMLGDLVVEGSDETSPGASCVAPKVESGLHDATKRLLEYPPVRPREAVLSRHT